MGSGKGWALQHCQMRVCCMRLWGGGGSSAERLVGHGPCGLAKKMSESYSVVYSCITRKWHHSVVLACIAHSPSCQQRPFVQPCYKALSSLSCDVSRLGSIGASFSM